MDQYGKGTLHFLLELDTASRRRPNALKLLHCPWLPSRCNFPHLQQQNPTMPCIRIQPQARPPFLVVFLDERPPVSDPSPSLINWMTPRHSAPLVSYCPDWLRLPRTKPNKNNKNKKREKTKTADPVPSPAAVRRAWYDPFSASIGVPFFSRATHAAACKHSVGRDGM